MDNQTTARKYGLRYIDDFSKGFTRTPRGTGFSFHDQNGKLIKDRHVRERLKSLAIPPAWHEVWIAPREHFHILARGRDDKKRRQYIYHPRWTELQTRNNFDRLLQFAAALPALRKQIDVDLRRTTLNRDKIVALVIYLLERTLIRVGNDAYSKENKTFGLTTLRDRHFEKKGNTLSFDFIGKSGLNRKLSLCDPRAARAIARCQELPGQRLFQYLDDAGRRRRVASSDVNDYLCAHTGEAITAKDFRTWGGTVWAATELAAADDFDNEREFTLQVNQALRKVAGKLGNTLAVCRAHYIHPCVLEAYKDGSLPAVWRRVVKANARQRNRLSPEERATIRLLEQY